MPSTNLNIAVTFTCFKRLDYLKQVVEAVKASFEYSNMFLPIFFSIDYHDDSIPNYIKKIDWTETSMRINRPSVGCNKNTRLALSMGLNEYDAIIHLEDDTVPSKDAISFFTKNLNDYYDDPSIYSIGGYNRTISLDKYLLFSKEKQFHFTCWGCAFWKHKSEILLNNWIPVMNRENFSISWDSHLNDNVFVPNKLVQIKPVISRIQNIGAENGTWVSDSSFHMQNHYSPYTSNDLL